MLALEVIRRLFPLFAITITSLYVFLVWILVFPAGMDKIKQAPDFAGIWLEIVSLIISPAMLILRLVLYTAVQIVMGIVIMIVIIGLVSSYPLYWVIEKQRGKPSLLERWRRIGRKILAVQHKLFEFL